MDKIIQTILYTSRWLLAPIYTGLVCALFTVLIKFGLDTFHLILQMTTIKESDLILNVLGLIDLTLIASLLVIIMLSGYENFIASNAKKDKLRELGWLKNITPSALKTKLVIAIVAISSIHLLQVFMSLSSYKSEIVILYIALHLTFVITAFLMALTNSKAH